MFSVFETFKDIIRNIEVIRYELEENQKRLHIKLQFKDDSLLVIKDYKFSNNTRKYSYHWMDKQGDLKVRWDNAPHWKTIETFPHHKHVGEYENIVASTETDIESILIYIREQLQQR